MPMDSHDPFPQPKDLPDSLASQSLSAVLDAIDALVYVADMETYDLYFINAYGRKVWGNSVGRKCWQVLQADQDGPCTFCNNPQLINEQGEPTDVLVWEFQNTVNGRWYQCRDQAITWINGRRARIEIATDITELKENVQALHEAKHLAETLSRTDDLTGLRNRRALLDDARMLFNLARRYGTDLMLVMLDMDHFKQVNDQYGHPCGDQVLKRITQAIQHSIRDVDVFGRYGGEEFMLVLPGLDVRHGLNTLERVRQAVADLDIACPQGSFRVSCSMGAALQGAQHCNLDRLIAEADQALYCAKQRGRNRVELAQPISATTL